MANKQQSMRAKKQAKRAKATKVKAKAGRIERNNSGQAFSQATKDSARKHKSIYDIINDRAKMRRLAKEGKGQEELFTRETLLQGVNEAIDVAVRLHAGMEVFERVAERQLITPTTEQLQLIIDADKAIVVFCEDVHAVKTLDEAKQQPEEYIDLVMHIADVMHEMMEVHRHKLLAMFEEYREPMETYAQEHLPSEFADDMVGYQHLLHGDRIDRVSPLYATGEAKEMMARLKEMEELFKDDPDLEHPTDRENLPAAEATPLEGELLLVDEPNDPVTQAQ